MPELGGSESTCRITAGGAAVCVHHKYLSICQLLLIQHNAVPQVKIVFRFREVCALVSLHVATLLQSSPPVHGVDDLSRYVLCDQHYLVQVAGWMEERVKMQKALAHLQV